MEITTKDNGFKVSNELEKVIARFEEVAIERFGRENIEKIEHFYYTDKMSMTDIILVNDRDYAHFNIYTKGVYFSGHTCTEEEYKIFTSLCWNDECYPHGKLF